MQSNSSVNSSYWDWTCNHGALLAPCSNQLWSFISFLKTPEPNSVCSSCVSPVCSNPSPVPGKYSRVFSAVLGPGLYVMQREGAGEEGLQEILSLLLLSSLNDVNRGSQLWGGLRPPQYLHRFWSAGVYPEGSKGVQTVSGGWLAFRLVVIYWKAEAFVVSCSHAPSSFSMWRIWRNGNI